MTAVCGTRAGRPIRSNSRAQPRNGVPPRQQTWLHNRHRAK